MKKIQILSIALSAFVLSIGAQASNNAQLSPKVRGTGDCSLFSYSIQKIGPTLVERNGYARYLIIVQNLGDCRLREVRVSDFLPEGTEFISASPSPSEAHDRKIEWNNIDIPAGQYDVFEVNARIEKDCRFSSLTDNACAFSRDIGTRICDSSTAQVVREPVRN